MKRRNAVIVKKELATVNKQEQELEQLLYREIAELDKVRATILLDMEKVRVAIKQRQSVCRVQQ